MPNFKLSTQQLSYYLGYQAYISNIILRVYKQGWMTISAEGLHPSGRQVQKQSGWSNGCKVDLSTPLYTYSNSPIASIQTSNSHYQLVWCTEFGLRRWGMVWGQFWGSNKEEKRATFGPQTWSSSLQLIMMEPCFFILTLSVGTLPSFSKDLNFFHEGLWLVTKLSASAPNSNAKDSFEEPMACFISRICICNIRTARHRETTEVILFLLLCCMSVHNLDQYFHVQFGCDRLNIFQWLYSSSLFLFSLSHCFVSKCCFYFAGSEIRYSDPSKPWKNVTVQSKLLLQGFVDYLHHEIFAWHLTLMHVYTGCLNYKKDWGSYLIAGHNIPNGKL